MHLFVCEFKMPLLRSTGRDSLFFTMGQVANYGKGARGTITESLSALSRLRISTELLSANQTRGKEQLEDGTKDFEDSTWLNI